MKSILAFILILISCRTFAQTADKLYEDALVAFHANNYGESIVLLKNTMFENPRHLSGRILLGRAYLLTGEFENAEKQFKQAITDGADKSQLVVPLGQSYLMQGKYEELLASTKVTSLPDNMKTEVYSLRGRAYLELDNYQQAREQFNLSISSNALEAVGYLGLAITELKLGNVSLADQWVERALNLKPDNAEALLLKGDIYFREGNYRLAKELLNQSLILDENGLRARLLLAEILLSESDIEKALEHIQFVLDKNPNYPNVNLLYAFALVKSGKENEAIKVAKNLSELLSKVDDDNFSKYPSLRLIQGTSLYMQESWENAYSHLNFYARQFPGHEKSHILVANMDIKFQRYDTALDILQHYTGQHKSLEFWLLNLHSMVQLGSFFEALIVVDNALKTYPDQIELLEYKVKLFLATENLTQALALLETIYQKGNANEQLTLLLGQLQLGVSELNKAKQIIDELLKESPNNPVYLSLAAGIELQLNNSDGAEAMLIGAIEVAPKMLQLYVNLYHVYIKQGKLELAVNSLHRARKISPSEPLLLTKLAEVAELIHNFEIATQWREQLHKLEPENLDNLVRYADDLIALKRGEQALNLLLPRRLDFRLEPQYLSRLAMAYVEVKQCADADPILGILTGLSLNDVERLSAIANMYMRCGRYELAHRALTNAENKDINNIQLQLTRAKWFLSIGQARLALKLISPLAGKENIAALKIQVSAYEQLNDLVAALNTSRKLYQLSPLPAHAYKMYQLLDTNDRKQEGVALLEEYLQRQNNRNIRRLLAQAYAELEQLDKSEENYLVLAQSFNDADAYRQLAILHSKSNEAKALKYATKAHEHDSNSPAIAATYGWLLVKAGEYEKGLAQLRFAHARNARQPTLLYRLAETLLLLNRPEQAKVYFEDAVKYDFPYREEALQRLENL